MGNFAELWDQCKILETLPTYPSPYAIFLHKNVLSVKVGLGEG